MEKFIRSALLLGEDAIKKLNKEKIVIFGLGGVGSFVCETLVRTGIENFVLIDGDQVSISNINRQLIATSKTIGKLKCDVMKERILEINNNCNVITYPEFVLVDNFNEAYFDGATYVIDCIDTISTKIKIVEYCHEHNIKLISAMGTGNKLDPTKFKITDISKTTMCPLAKVMRYELRKRNIFHLTVLYSDEEPINLSDNPLEMQLLKDENCVKTSIPGSVAFCPSIAGIMIARYVLLDLIKQ